MIRKIIEQLLKDAIQPLVDYPIYIGYVPTDQLQTITIKRTGSDDMRCYNREIGNGRINKSFIQIYIQSDKYEDGLRLCQKLVDYFDGIPQKWFTAFTDGSIIPLGMAKNLKGEIFMFSINFTVWENEYAAKI